MTTRTKAGENEHRFEQLFQRYAPNTALNGKKRYKRDNVEISVDQSFIHEGVEYLVEVDSANMAKLLTGQYVLLNQLYTGNKAHAFFLLVHTYRAYNPRRTINNLELINKEVYGGTGIAFGAVHIDQLSEGWADDVSSFLAMLRHA
ncbi:hypothetical protein [Vreelandella neptunia]|uniref:Uncharacterized protein n=1 Tax=Vreelandella neptunia TaxID=115551 RepID=A0ABZ0YSK3_9GAMM|nr:hypothetical protein [Halomonas neptunia]MDN3559253.1 hypothetical protein [Halomonas neptunia]WQH14212.1 hypothetical protein SR894_06640 [Halomonas neptunia]